MNQNNTLPTKLKVAFPSMIPFNKYEPTAIQFDFEYIFLENVFSPLVEVAKDGLIEPGVAESFDWTGDELKLTIRSNLKTITGQQITSDDVLFSLKRLLVLSGNTHGNFKDIVCPGLDLKSVEDDCDGIRKDDKAIYIKTKGGKAFLLPMLSAIDFAIIPKSSVDPKTLKIVNYSETSGVYSVFKQADDGRIYLKANPNHYFYSKNIAQEVDFVPTNTKVKGDSLRMFEAGLVDHIMTVDASKSDEVLVFLNEKNSDDFESHVTMKIKTSYVQFTQRGLKDFTSDERRMIGQKIKQAFINLHKNIKGSEARSEFFPHFSEGGLDPKQQSDLDKLSLNVTTSLNKPVKIGLMKRSDLEEWADPINKELPQANCYLENKIPEFTKYDKIEDMPHVFVANTDTGFLEDISLISYTLNAGLLGLSKEGRNKWLADYMSTDNKNSRMEKLKKLHYEALAEPILVPLLASPYTALTRKPWKMELSTLFANNQLWRIKNQ